VTDAELLEQALERVLERVGDPAPLVYERLFQGSPQLREMFVMDTLGSVRGEMFHRAIETLLDLADARPYAGSMIAAEWSNHHMNGVSKAQFDGFFVAMGETFRQALGGEWTADIDGAWSAAVGRIQHITTEPAAGA
jgi:hypothetical protein